MIGSRDQHARTTHWNGQHTKKEKDMEPVHKHVVVNTSLSQKKETRNGYVSIENKAGQSHHRPMHVPQEKP